MVTNGKTLLEKIKYLPPLDRQKSWTFNGPLAVQISRIPLGTNRRGETMSSVTLTTAPEAQQAQWFCSEASRTKVWMYWVAPRCMDVTFFLLVNNNTFLSEVWSPSNFGSSVSDDF